MKWLKIAILLLALIAAAAGIWLKNHADTYGNTIINLDEPILFELERGTSFVKFVNLLAKQDLIESADKLRLFIRFNPGFDQIKSGEYRIEPGLSYVELLNKFNRGEVVQRSFTLVEGLTLKDYLSQFEQHEELINTLKDKSYSDVAELVGIEQQNPEGWFFPDTYSFTKGTTDLDILKRAYQRTKKVLDEEWEKRAKNLPLKTPYETLILASIVEKETGAPEEREQIAGVFIRRLNKGMRLQTDPTVIYGMGDSYKGNIRRSDLKKKTAYNTYQINGLPPTPIASAGREAIHAALNPDDGKTLYFVAKGNGRHYFSKTLAEHNKAVYQYQKQRRQDYRSSVNSNP